MQTNETIIDRIMRMELYFDTISKALHSCADSVFGDARLNSMLNELTSYYENGQWLADYDTDERGELPHDLKRGVLSQDSLYNLLCEIEQIKGQITMIKGIHHISMRCQNEEEYRKVRSFYTEILHLSVIKECDVCILLDTGSGIVEVFRDGAEPSKKGVIRHFAFAADDVQACVNAVEQAGYEVFIAPKTVHIGDDPAFPATIAFCRGPLGEEIEFFCQGW